MTTSSESWVDDPVLASVIHQACEDPAVAGVLLGGSRGAGCADDWSDYDLSIVLTDDAFDERCARGEDARVKPWRREGRLDLSYTCLRELDRLAANPGWWTPGYATTRVLLDKTGAVTRALEAIVSFLPEKARADAAAWFDAYLNGFYRSLKAWRRGNELGARLEAAESMMHLVRALFSLEGLWPPYHDRLTAQLRLLAGQGWSTETLSATILAILRTADPTLQQRLEAEVEDLMRDRGFGGVVDEWGPDIPEVRSWQFADYPGG